MKMIKINFYNIKWKLKICNNIKIMKINKNIINLNKPDSLYNYGMKILSYSTRMSQLEGTGWHRVGEDIEYSENEYKRDGGNRFSRYHCTLSFVATF